MSGLTTTDPSGNCDLNSCQYLIMDNRCMHELKTLTTEKVAEKIEKMEYDSECSASISVTELGNSVLTLSEVLLTFEHNSAMFNIKMES